MNPQVLATAILLFFGYFIVPAPAVAAGLSPLFEPGAWCAAYQPEDQSCSVVRMFEPLPAGTAVVRQVSVGRERSDLLQKIVIDLQAQVDGTTFCYDAGYSVLDGIQVYAGGDRSPQPTAADAPMPRAEVEHHLARSGIKPALVGQRVCVSMPASEWTLIPPAHAAAIVLRDF